MECKFNSHAHAHVESGSERGKGFLMTPSLSFKCLLLKIKCHFYTCRPFCLCGRGNYCNCCNNNNSNKRNIECKVRNNHNGYTKSSVHTTPKPSYARVCAYLCVRLYCERLAIYPNSSALALLMSAHLPNNVFSLRFFQLHSTFQWTNAHSSFAFIAFASALYD